jgi:oxygen-dependent protoporphyrinogen oxidase
VLNDQQYDIVILGGGISGMASAIKLAESGKKVLLLESQNELGGKIKTSSIMGIVTEEGPDELITGYGKFDELSKLTGAVDNFIYPETLKFLIYSRNKLRQFPESLITGVPSLNLKDLYNFVTSGLLSFQGYVRAMFEPFVKLNNLSGDVDIKFLFEKKFGSEFSKNVIDPLFGGIMGADISIISSKSYIPYIYKIAKDGKSLSLYFTKRRSQKHYSIVSTQNGLGGIVKNFKKFAEAKGVRIITGQTAISVNNEYGTWRILTDTNNIKCSKVVLTVPAPSAAKLVSDVDKKLSYLLSSIKYSDIVVVNSIYKKSDIKLQGAFSGFLMPSNSGFKLRGSTFMSRKWNYAKMDNYELLRSFINMNYGKDEEFYAQRAAEELIQIGVTNNYPVKYVVRIWNSAMPIYMVGHDELVHKINDMTPPNMYLAGAPYKGIGVASSGVSGIEAAEKILSSYSNCQ